MLDVGPGTLESQSGSSIHVLSVLYQRVCECVSVVVEEETWMSCKKCNFTPKLSVWIQKCCEVKDVHVGVGCMQGEL